MPNPYDKFDRRVNAAGAVRGPLKIKVLLNAAQIYKKIKP
tara:strand:+ start:40 stop:159 length:120 start_codon:yes stop_codon:yes gene_type:complete